MTAYAHPERRELPFWRRCKTRHSKGAPARCRHPRGHEGEHWFGWQDGRNLDLAVKILGGAPRMGAPEDFDG